MWSDHYRRWPVDAGGGVDRQHPRSRSVAVVAGRVVTGGGVATGPTRGALFLVVRGRRDSLGRGRQAGQVLLAFGGDDEPLLPDVLALPLPGLVTDVGVHRPLVD